MPEVETKDAEVSDDPKSVWVLLDELVLFGVADLASANGSIDAGEQRRLAEYIAMKVGQIRVSYGSVLCPVHLRLDQSESLAPFDNCIACIRGERDELRAAIEPFIPKGQQVDSVIFLRELLERKEKPNVN